MSWQLPPRPAGQRIHPFWRVAGTTVKFGWRTMGRPLVKRLSKQDKLWRQDGEGFIDIPGRRSMVDYGSYAELQLEDRVSGGRSGRALADLSAAPAKVASPLWLIDLLGGIVSAREVPADAVPDDESSRWRRFAATVSLPEAAAKRSNSMPSPKAERYQDLLELPLEVWLDDAGIRRLSYSEGSTIREGGTTDVIEVVTFSNFGTSIEELDWDRLPAFRTPDAEAGEP